MSGSDTKRALANLADERNGAYLYRALAEAEKDKRLGEVYSRLAAAEERHAERWEQQLAESGVAVPAFRPSWRSRLLAALARRFGASLVLPTVAANEQTDSGKYASTAGAADMAGDEASHARLLGNIVSPGGLEGSQVAQLEGRHRSGGGNALRAAVLGANDGLVSNLSLVMGVAGAATATDAGGAVLVAGLAGLLAGACSMALGEWLSVQSSRELYQKQIEVERQEIAANPQEEAEELALIYESRGVPAERARELAGHIVANQASALDTLAREELGIDPQELGGSAWEAALTSFVLFAIGAIVPVVPFFFTGGLAAVLISAAASTMALFVLGAAITLFTGRGVVFSGMRMVLFGLAAAAVTFGIGRLIGVSIAG